MYSKEDIKEALKGAGLPDYVRHAVYSNLPAKATAPEGRTLLMGGAYDKVSFTDLNGDHYEGTFVVAAASLDKAMREAQQIVLWNPVGIAEGGSMQARRTALTANYSDVKVNHAPIKGVA